MASNSLTRPGEYALATGADAVGRLNVLHRIYSDAGREALIDAGLMEGMDVADFGCGPGAMTRMLASLVGSSGSVTGIDLHAAQIEQARQCCASDGLANTTFVTADACGTALPGNRFDLVYCRFLLLHLLEPAACLREMWRVLKPGGILLVEDGDLASACSVPPTALDAFANLVWSRYRNSLTQRGIALSAQLEADPRVTSGCKVATIPLTSIFDSRTP